MIAAQSRDGTGYRDVTGSSSDEVLAARDRFAQILKQIPKPEPHPIGAQDAATNSSKDRATEAMDQARLKRFNARDKNQDGRIDQQEFAATEGVGKNAEAIQDRFGKMDANGDGGITLAEFLKSN